MPGTPSISEIDLEAGSIRLAPKTAESEPQESDSETIVVDGSSLRRPRAPSPVPNQTDADADPDSRFIVDWGENDLEQPTKWSSFKKWKNLWIVSAITFITPLASSMFAPGVPQLMKDFNSDDRIISSFVVSVYILGFAIGPLIIAPMCELYGRKKLYQCCNVLFFIFTIACSEATNLHMLLACRFFAGCAGVAPLTIGAGSIGDLMVAEKRGGAMAIFSVGPLLGPIIGASKPVFTPIACPIAGGFITQGIGWRWVFRILASCSLVVTFVSLFFLDETYSPTLLARRAASLRKQHSEPAYRSKYASDLPAGTVFANALKRPLKMLFMSPIVALLSIHVAFVYGLLYLLFTTLTPVFIGIYGLTTGTAGLMFLGLGVGSILGVMVIGGTSDKIYMHYQAKNGGVGKPEFRLPALMYCSLFVPVGLFWYGWSAESDKHLLVPIFGTVLIAFGMLSVMVRTSFLHIHPYTIHPHGSHSRNPHPSLTPPWCQFRISTDSSPSSLSKLPVQSYLVDAYTQYAASAVAAVTILRSLLGALLPLAGQPMYAALGFGWGNTLLGSVALALVPVPWVFWRYGERIRGKMTVSLD
ncbi:hypothetical protein MBM_07617 [Drepanopeziza brunnea f. sp. 'multigermtubi' MB_m1]|uniref:Major facilitator superfamily (MFS) profile domain-containing protein n=1 Tax=Marssonina brunnea f. sp. multigermtubi (strain MB_m1) TaxID=1072389 RepID=K1WPT0_MARBU|nr:uncharacterized protein MBM_07617 [Drepanopeziza brunnea f. sp. 'multigermtubi' MB_m1]EKD14387.1 hypothetical protein MBM_07617 [Drepanopeziza brunnea f. sp. 'multigermtubi' MB_m1]